MARVGDPGPRPVRPPRRHGQRPGVGGWRHGQRPRVGGWRHGQRSGVARGRAGGAGGLGVVLNHMLVLEGEGRGGVSGGRAPGWKNIHQSNYGRKVFF